MVPFDSATLERHRQAEARQKTVQDSDRWVARELQHACYVSDSRTSVANTERQVGKPMSAPEFIKLISGLSHDLLVEYHPFIPDVLCVYQLKNVPNHIYDPINKVFGGQQKIFVCGAHGPILPEWSIMSTKRVEVPTQNRHVSHDSPGMMQQTIPWNEERRGWRTVLVVLAAHGLVPTDRVERIAARLGSEDRPSWQAHLGKAQREVPF